ncbi:MAG: hypothetical protein J6S29_05570 [Methanosphaera sp.]|nr:hypothetical protein [Methanosphaera sp.]
MEYVEIVVDNFADYNDIIHDFLSRGFSLARNDEKSVCLKKNSYGHFKYHLLLFVFTIWWSFGLINLLYLLFSYFMNVKGYKIIFVNDNNVSGDNVDTFNYKFTDNEYITRYLLSGNIDKSDSSKDFQNDSSLPIVRFLED